MEPAAFATQLIARLERLKREQETMSSLEERLQQIQEVGISGGFYDQFTPAIDDPVIIAKH